MTASPADSHTPRGLERSLSLRFSSLLLLFVALSGGTCFAVSWAVSTKEYASIQVNLAGRQRLPTWKVYTDLPARYGERFQKDKSCRVVLSRTKAEHHSPKRPERGVAS